MSEKIKVSIVSYLNSKPFLYGITHSGILDSIELSEDIPADCAQKLINDTVDIGLIPVAVIPLIPQAQIVSDFCIGTLDDVNSVFLLSNTPIEEIYAVYLDRHSRTSNNLCKVLLKNHWKKKVTYIARAEDFVDLKQGEAMVLIGDRTFGIKNKYTYVYDLSSEWKKLTGLPFVFAAWVSNKVLPSSFIEAFNTALKLGVDQRSIVAAENLREDFDISDYLMHKLHYPLDDAKRKAIKLFLEYCTKL